jgi:hypothetical protein
MNAAVQNSIQKNSVCLMFGITGRKVVKFFVQNEREIEADTNDCFSRTEK